MINIYNKYDLLGGFANFIPKEDELLVPYSVDFATFSKENYVLSHKEKEDGYLCDVLLNPAYAYKYLRN